MFIGVVPIVLLSGELDLAEDLLRVLVVKTVIENLKFQK